MLAALAWLPLLSGCRNEAPVYEEKGYVFGTQVEVTIYGEDDARARAAAASVMHEFQRLHTMLHAWQPSELRELNAAFARGNDKQASSELEAILQDAARLSAQSEGLFNPAIGGLIEAWGFQADDFKGPPPDGKKIAALVKANPQMSDISVVDIRGVKAASSRNRAVQLDLGGYAKGYALDRAAELLKRQGIHNALVNIGGNILALGQHGDRPWRVGIQHPRKPGPLATLELHDGEAVGTSGDYQRFFEFAGRRYCHVIDPRTGLPVQGVQAATILTHGAQAGVRSDAASKPLFISGVAGWRAAAARMGVDEALLVDETGDVHVTAAMQKRLEFTDKQTTRQVE